MTKPIRYVVIPDSGFALHTITAIRPAVKAPIEWVERGLVSTANAELELYNLLLPGKQVNKILDYSEGRFQTLKATDTLLVSFAILPYTDGTIAWQPIRLDTLHSYVYSFPDFVWEANKRL